MNRWLRGALYCAGFITWGLAIGGVGRVAAWIIGDIRERDAANTKIVTGDDGKRYAAIVLCEVPDP